MPELTVVVPTIGNYPVLRRVLDRLEAQDAPLEAFEVVVVADAAEPECAAVDRAVGDRPYAVRRLTGRVPGASANRNAGWRAAGAPLVLFIDNDTLPEPQLVFEHLAWHRRHPREEIGVLGRVRWARELRVTPFMRWLDHGMQFDYPGIRGNEAGWGRFYSANVSVKKGLLERVDGFDEERLPYLYEDLDFGYRASKLGLRLLYNPRAVVEHLRQVDVEFWRGKMRRLAAAERAFCRIHPEIPPYFQRRFSEAARAPRARGRGVRLIRFVPRWAPWIGRRAWTSADLYFRQSLASDFLAAWEAEESSEAPEASGVPSALERAASSSGGSRPSGPK